MRQISSIRLKNKPATGKDFPADPHEQVWNAIATDVPVVFLYYTDYLYAQSRTLQGFRVAPVNDPPQRFWNVEDWYLKTVVRQ